MNATNNQLSNSIFSEKYFCGIDLASKVIQLSVTRPGGESFDVSLSIDKFDEYINEHCSDDYIYAMEACGNSNYWADKIRKLGATVYIFPAQKCRSYNHGCKDDKGDARGVRDLLLTYIASPNTSTIHPCIIRDKQSIADKHIVKAYLDVQSDLTIHLRRLIAFFKELDATIGFSYSMSVQQILEIATEYIAKLQEQDEDNNISLITDIQDQCAMIGIILQRRSHILAAFEQYSQKHPACKLLMAVPGVSILLAVAVHIITQGNFKRFKTARAFAAYLGMVPEHSGTGGKNRIGHLSDKGNPVLKALLYEAANACFNLEFVKSKKNKKDRRDKREKIKIASAIARAIWKIGINLDCEDIKEKVEQHDPKLAEKLTEKNTNTKLSKFKSKCNKLTSLLNSLTSSEIIKDWFKSNIKEKEKLFVSPCLDSLKDKLIDLSSNDIALKRVVEILDAYFNSHTEVPKLEITDADRLSFI